MAPKRSTATAAAAAAGRPSKAAKKDSMAVTCKSIADALEIAGKKDVPADVTNFLGAALKHTLPTYKEERHEFQVAVLNMVEKTLGDAESVLLEEVASAEAIVKGGDDEKTKREAAVVSADQDYKVCKETAAEKITLKADKSEAFKATLLPLKEAEAQRDTGDAAAVEVEKAKEALNAACTELLAPMKEAGGGKRQLHSFAKQLKTAELDDSLLEAMELPLGKKPEDRGRFDAVILEQLDVHVSEKVAAFEAKLKEEAPAREARSAAVQAAQHAHNSAQEALEAASEELKAAKVAEVAAKAAAGDAHRSVKSLASELQDAAHQLDSARQRLEEFRSGPLASFKELLERSAPEPEREEQPSEKPEAAAAEVDSAPPATTA